MITFNLSEEEWQETETIILSQIKRLQKEADKKNNRARRHQIEGNIESAKYYVRHAATAISHEYTLQNFLQSKTTRE